jgi:hypothetical protein
MNKLLAIGITAINQQLSGGDFRLGLKANGNIIVEKYVTGTAGKTYKETGEFESLEAALHDLDGWEQVHISSQTSGEINFLSCEAQECYR